LRAFFASGLCERFLRAVFASGLCEAIPFWACAETASPIELVQMRRKERSPAAVTDFDFANTP
jgi:hypothetical protein